MADYSIRLAPHDEVARRWERIAPILRNATERTYGCFEPVDVLRLILIGQQGLWLIEALPCNGGDLLAVVVTEVRQYPRKRVLEVAFIAGAGLACWHRALVERLEAHARRMECSAIAGWGRRGWSRFGFEDRGAIMVRDLV